MDIKSAKEPSKPRILYGDVNIRPKVSICMITYNHELFIRQAIESVLMQQTNFEFKLVIGEDCSLDRTRSIVYEYVEKWPDIIIPLFHPQNIGAIANFITTYHHCQGQYIAFLEGDDYWTDSYKLQKQADFLDKHHEVVMCAHWAEILNQKDAVHYSKIGPKVRKSYYTLDDILMEWHLFKLCTIMSIKEVLPSLPIWFSESLAGDLMLYTLLAYQGNIGFIDESMAMYRMHHGGLAQGQREFVVLQMAEPAFRTFKTHLHLHHRLSYRHRLSEIYSRLCELCAIENNFSQSFIYAYKAVKIVPFSSKISLCIHLLFILFRYQAYWGFVMQIFQYIKMRGLRLLKHCCGERIYFALKILYDRVKIFD